MARINLSSPWVLFYHEVEAMFKGDDGVRVVLNEDEMKLELYVDSPTKADAIGTLLPEEKVFGGVTLEIIVYPGNKTEYKLKNVKTALTPCDIFDAAFKDNKALSFTQEINGAYNNPIYYIVFKKKVVQYFTDDLGDIFGQRSTLYQEMAKDIFVEMDGVHYCTDSSERNYGTVSISGTTSPGTGYSNVVYTTTGSSN